MTPLLSPAMQLCLRSAAEDLRLSLDGWVEVPAVGDDTRRFGHRDNEALLVTVRCAGSQWEWSAGSALAPGAQQPWCRVHDHAVEVCGNERTALLSALHLAGDDMQEAAGCATATLHARLETITRHRGLDLFVTPAEPGGGAAPDPVTPRAIVWAITARDRLGEFQAQAAIAAGAGMVNDVSGLDFDPGMAGVVARAGVALCLMHAQGIPETMQDNPTYGDVLLDVYDALAERIARAEAAGIPRDRIVIDPGIGFGKTQAHNLAILRRISVYHGLGCAVLLGVSRKGFIGAIGGAPRAADRAAGTLAVTLAGVAQGIQIHRVHDVEETRQGLALWRAVTGGDE